MTDAIQTIQREIHPAPKPESTKHLRVLANGAVYDMNKKRIVDSKNVTNKITSQNAADYAAARQEAKRARLMTAANAVAAQGGGVDGRELTGDLAFVEAIGEAMTMKALTVNDPKAVDAARFLFQETGIAETKQPETVNNTVNVIALPDDIAGLFADLRSRLSAPDEGVIDSQVVRTDILNSDNGAHSIDVDSSPTDPEPGT